MKHTIKKIYFSCVALLILILYACGPDDHEIEWGFAKIYMPQAAILNGGLSNDYPVPLSNNPSTENYTIDSINNILKITLGVYRSGLQPLQAYSVTVAADIEAANTALTNMSRGVLLPADTYTLPSTVAVSKEERQAIFYLEVDLNKLINDYSLYAKNQLILL